MEKRTALFLCTKEVKGEFNLYMKFMGRTNWAIKNLKRASLVMMFIPGLQGAAANAEKTKEYLKYSQTLRQVSYMKTLANIARKNCPLDPRMYKSPFKLSRDKNDALQLAEEKWTYIYFLRPYALTIKIDAQNFESIHPQMKYLIEEKLERSSFPLRLP